MLIKKQTFNFRNNRFIQKNMAKDCRHKHQSCDAAQTFSIRLLHFLLYHYSVSDLFETTDVCELSSICIINNSNCTKSSFHKNESTNICFSMLCIFLVRVDNTQNLENYRNTSVLWFVNLALAYSYSVLYLTLLKDLKK